MRIPWKHLACIVLLAVACAPARQPVAGRVPVEVLVNGVDGGKNARDVEWLRRIEPWLERELPGVDVLIATDGGSDESYKARLVLDLYGGRGSDVISFDSFWTAGMASAGLLLPLDPFLRDWDEWRFYPESMRAMGSYGGKTYLVPFLTDVRGLYYRQDLFRQAGIPLPWRPRSWEDVFQAGEQLQALPGVIPIQWNAGTAAGEATTMQGILPVLLSAGGQLHDGRQWVVSGRPLEQTLEFYRELYVRRRLADVALQLDPKGRERSFELFRDGKIGIYPEGTYMWLGVLRPGQTWGIPNRDEVVDWAPMPALAGGVVSVSGGNGYILNQNSAHPEASWQVLRLMASRRSQEVRMELSPFVPPRTDLTGLLGDDPVLQRQLREALPLTTFRPGLPLYPRVSERLQQAVERVIQGQSPSDSLERYAREVRRLVE
ncbi:MAG: extracellular solute-binding protein [Candidatus Eremiobacterota bacterium]